MNSKASITGFGCLSSAGVDATATRASFFSKSGAVPLLDSRETRFFKLPVTPEWSERFAVEPAAILIPSNLFACIAAEEALRDANLSLEQLRRLRVGICLGSTVGSTNHHESFDRAFFLGDRPSADPFFLYFQTNTAQFLGRHLGVRGPRQMINNACASGADALGIGAAWLDADLCDVVLCGGSENMLPKMYYGFKSLQLCASQPCQPFDVNRQGLTLGEGAGIVVLEKPRSPRPARVHLLGYGASSDALHPTSPHPEGRGLKLATDAALTEAGVPMAAVDFVNAHATATVHNDLAEGQWLKAHVGQARVVATKGYTGHALGAAGALEAVFTALCLVEGKLPVSKGFAQMDPRIGLEPTQTIESGDYKIALSCSLGFGGANSVLCLGKAQ